MNPQRLDVAAVLAAWERFDAVIDARSESEFAHDHLPQAQNWPTLNDAERAAIGTQYKQVSPQAARREGAVLALRNIARHLEQHLPAVPRDWQPLVYCWRGGQRSGALATVLAAVGFRVSVLEGGWQAFRRHVLADLEHAGQGLALVVLCGPTGSGKSRLLHALQRSGQQVLDLEALACHRGSVLGALPDAPQPSQKHFETRLWQRLRELRPGAPVFVESESRVIGRLRLPQALFDAMRNAPCVRLEVPVAERVRALHEDYRHFVRDAEALGRRLAVLTELRGKALVQRWQELARGGDTTTLVQELLETHYDPAYRRSIHHDYLGWQAAPTLDLPSLDADALQAVAEASADWAAPARSSASSTSPASPVVGSSA